MPGNGNQGNIFSFPFTGVNFMDDCDAEPLIPVFLIVFGVSALLIVVCIIFIFIAMFCTDKVCFNVCLGFFGVILVLFYLAWLAVGKNLFGLYIIFEVTVR